MKEERWFCPHCNKEVIPIQRGFDFGKMEIKEKITDKMAERIYKRYPRKVGHDAAIKAIKKALRHCNQRELARKVKAYAKSVEDVEKKYIPHPSTWFNQGRWKDEIESKEGGEKLTDPQLIKCRDEVKKYIEERSGKTTSSDLKKINNFIFFLDTLKGHIGERVLYFWGGGKLNLYLFIVEYLQYVEDQQWLKCPNISSIDHKSKLFNQYIIHIRNDIGIDLLTGRKFR